MMTMDVYSYQGYLSAGEHDARRTTRQWGGGPSCEASESHQPRRVKQAAASEAPVPARARGAGPAGGRAEAEEPEATRQLGNWPTGPSQTAGCERVKRRPAGGLEKDPRADMHGMAWGAAFSPRALSHRRGVTGRLFPGLLLLPIGRAAPAVSLRSLFRGFRDCPVARMPTGCYSSVVRGRLRRFSNSSSRKDIFGC